MIHQTAQSTSARSEGLRARRYLFSAAMEPLQSGRTPAPDTLLTHLRAFAAGPHDQARYLWRPPRGRNAVAVRLRRFTDARGLESFELLLEPASVPYGLTPRELEVTTLVAMGLSNPAIAAALHTSPRTVSTQVERIMGKLDVNSRTALASLAMENAVLCLPLPPNAPALEGTAIGDLHLALGAPRAASEPVRRRRTSASRTWRIGAVFPIDGPAAPDGMDMLQGTQLAVDEINHNGGIGGRAVEVVYEGVDIFDMTTIEDALNRVAGQDIDALTCGYLTPEAPGALDTLAAMGIPVLHTATHDAHVQQVISDPTKYANVFQTCPSEVHYGLGFLRVLADLRRSGRWVPTSRNLTIVQADSASTRIATEELLAAADRDGWTVSIVAAPLHSTAWESCVDQALTGDPAAVMFAHFLLDASVAFTREFRRRHTSALLYHTYGPSIAGFREELGQDADGILWSTVTGSYNDALGRSFRERFRQTFGRTPGFSQAGATYDQVHLLAQAWAFAGRSAQPSPHLRRITHRGVNGVYAMSEPGQTTLSYPEATFDISMSQAQLTFQIHDGRNRVIAPIPFGAVENFVRPSWVAAAGAA